MLIRSKTFLDLNSRREGGRILGTVTPLKVAALILFLGGCISVDVLLCLLTPPAVLLNAASTTQTSFSIMSLERSSHIMFAISSTLIASLESPSFTKHLEIRIQAHAYNCLHATFTSLHGPVIWMISTIRNPFFTFFLRYVT